MKSVGRRTSSRLARYTLETALNAGETMDCPLFPRSSLRTLLFASPKLPGPFRFDGAEYELLLCIGITPRELSRCRDSGSAVVVEELETRKMFPFTDIARDDAVVS